MAIGENGMGNQGLKRRTRVNDGELKLRERRKDISEDFDNDDFVESRIDDFQENESPSLPTEETQG
jgi:hypothetical protein